ncbi:MAG: hypothetical protein GY765_37055 [bacterium]|nr:hypothetical protein [bacterium]
MSETQKKKITKSVDEVKTPEEILKETYGCFDSPRTADEIIDDIYSARRFTDKNLQL